MPVLHAAMLYGVLSMIVVTFQIMLALGMPWGHLAMGGKYPGVFSVTLRISALFQGALLMFFTLVLLSHAGVVLLPLDNLIWLILVVLVSSISFILNVITPSFYERLLWGPVTGGLFFSSCVVLLYS